MDLSALFKDTNGNSMSFDGDNASIGNRNNYFRAAMIGGAAAFAAVFPARSVRSVANNNTRDEFPVPQSPPPPSFFTTATNNNNANVNNANVNNTNVNNANVNNANVNNKKASGSGVRPSESDESDDFTTDDEPPMKRTRCDDNKGKGKMSNKRRPRRYCNPIIPNPNIRALIANPDVTNEELMEIKSTQFYTKNGHASKALKDGAANTAKVLKMLSYGLKYNMADMLNVSGSSYCLYCLLCCN